MAVKNGIKKAAKRVGQAFGITELKEQLDRIEHSINYSLELQKNLDKISLISQRIENSQKELQDNINRLEKIKELYFFSLFKKSSESEDETKKRFFKTMPKASGNLLLIQQGNSKLLKIFDKICNEYKIPYWAHGGTLLGAVRHGGSIPWDDDVDVTMMRDDIHKLEKALKKTDYHITIVYDSVNVSKQLRFRNKDHNIPCFIDIFIYDYATENTKDTWAKWLLAREKIIKNTRESKNPILIKWQKQIVSDHNDDNEMSRLLDNYYEKLYGDVFGEVHTGGPGNIISAKEAKKDPNNFKYVIRGLDNLTPLYKTDLPRIYPKNLIFPLSRIEFDNFQICAPHNYDQYLRLTFGDYLEIPKDLITHFQHIDKDNLDKTAIEKFINNKFKGASL